MKLSQLLGVAILNAEGRCVGHVMDMRGPQGASPGDLRITQLVFGDRGFLERIGFGSGKAQCVELAQVETMSTQRIVLRAGAKVETLG